MRGGVQKRGRRATVYILYVCLLCLVTVFCLQWIYQHGQEKLLETFELDFAFADLIPVAHAQQTTGNPHVVESKLFNPRGALADARVDITDSAGKVHVVIARQKQKLKPGVYRLEMTMEQDGVIYTASQYFAWGVLAINTNKGVYRSSEEAYIQMAALNNGGSTLCNASLRLTIISPDGHVNEYETENGSITQSDTCGADNVTDDPDYWVRYTTGGEGVYTMTLENLDTGYDIEETFNVYNDMPFYIERMGATRINPFKSAYEMKIVVEAAEDFSGGVAEEVPSDFIVTDAGKGSVTKKDETQKILWDVTLQAGERKTLRYIYQAPRVSPEIFSLGPIVVLEDTGILGSLFGLRNTAYGESRRWQLASDAIGDIGHWRDSIGGQIPTTSFAPFEFDQEIRNDGIYTRPDDSTIELDQAGSYLIISTIRGVDNSNGRYNAQARVALTSGSGTLFTSYYTGYSRDNSENTTWFRAVGVVIGASADAQIQIQRRRDTDTPTSGSIAGESDVQVVRIKPDNYGLYAIGGTSGSLGGTTPNTVDITAVTAESDTNAIEGNTSTETVTVKGDNKRYLIGWSVSGDTGGNRTQRIGQLEYDGTDDLATRSYCYQRSSSNEYCGLGSMDLLETATADRAIQVEVYRGDGVSADQGGADSDGSFDVDGNGQLIVLELPDTIEVFRSHDATGLQNITSAATLNAMRTVDFNDATSFTQSSNAAMDVTNPADVFVWTNVWTARNDISSGSRLTAYGSITVNGVEQSTGEHGNYTRGNQGSQDTFAGSFHPAGIFNVGTAGHDIGVNMDPLSGTEGGGTDRTQAGTVGFFAINLSSLGADLPGDPTLLPDDGGSNQIVFNNSRHGDTTPIVRASSTHSDTLDHFQVEFNTLSDFTGTSYTETFSGTYTPDVAYNFQTTASLGLPTKDDVIYYVRVRASADGGNTWSGWSTDTWSYTYKESNDTADWYQTEDAQFNTNTLQNVVVQNDNIELIGGVIGEYGRVTVTDDATSTVSLNNTYSDLVVVASPRHQPDADVQRVARITRKATDSFDIKVHNHTSTTNPSGSTVVDWIAMESGAYTIEDGSSGTKVIAGTRPTPIIGYNGSWPTGSSVTFTPSFDAAPAVVHNIASNNNAAWVASMVNDGTQQGEPTASGMNALMNCSFDASCPHTSEDIDYIAFDTGHGTNNSVEFDAVVGTDTTSCCSTSGYATNYSSAFSSVPEVTVVSQMGEDGGNGGYAVTHTGTAGTASTHYNSIDEDGPSADRSHTDENVSVIAFDALSGNIFKQNAATAGVATSTDIEFGWVIDQNKWGEVVWNTTEPSNTDIKMHIAYDSGSGCTTPIPDLALSGNSSGFDISESPLDISGISTTTYATLCLVADFSSGGINSPALNDWSVTWEPPVSANNSPNVSSITLNAGNDVTLNEGTFVYATTTITVSDADGCDDISNVTAKLYRTAPATLGTTCTLDDNDCYTTFNGCVATTTGNTCGASPDTSGEFDCSFRLWYVADPTDSGSFAGDVWTVAATTTDGIDTSTATNTGELIDVLTLIAHDITTAISYGTVSPGSNTGNTNQTVIVTNTGNAALDTQISGDDMCTDYPTCSGNTIPVGQQKYDLSDVVYSSLSFTLSNTPTQRETILAKPTATTTAITDILYWGISVLGGSVPGTYNGENTFTPVAD